MWFLVRQLAWMLGILVLLPITSEFSIEYARSLGLYENPQGKVGAVLSAVADHALYPWIAGGVVGFAIGVWLDWMFRPPQTRSPDVASGTPQNTCDGTKRRILTNMQKRQLGAALRQYRDDLPTVRVQYFPPSDESADFGASIRDAMSFAQIKCNLSNTFMTNHDTDYVGVIICYRSGDDRHKCFATRLEDFLLKLSYEATIQEHEYTMIYVGRVRR